MNTPLADRMRPQTIDEYTGQDHLIGKGKPITRMIETGNIRSMILWGPPGCGKTTLASLIAQKIDADFVPFSGVTSSIKDIRVTIQHAEQNKHMFQKDTILFIDEIHRFNKAQQDAFLPAVETGIITLIGTTTENPGFEVNAPLISRSQVYLLKPLSSINLTEIVKKAIKYFPDHVWQPKAIESIIQYSNGDARVCINAVELSASISKKVTTTTVKEALQNKSIGYDKKGDSHFDTISAFIKSMRGNQPDATLHYLARMIKAGEDPVFIARRMVIFASEDIGNAQPTALVLATACMQAVHMIGMPEAQIILAQTATYLATAKKSTASYFALIDAQKDVEEKAMAPIPLHLRNASNNVMKDAGYGKDHIRYPYKTEPSSENKTKQEYMPENIEGKVYYKPDWKTD